MEQTIRGMKCALDYHRLKDFLKQLPQTNMEVTVPWCLFDETVILRNYKASKQDLKTVENHRIWELELQCFFQTADPIDIATYQDFLLSSCVCCLFYFDCGYLEIYVKCPIMFQQFWGCLVDLDAEDLQVITDSNDTRTFFSV